MTIASKIASRLDTLLDGAVARGVAPGIAAVVTDRETAVYDGAAGTLAVGDDRAATIDTLFRVASMTKPLTTIAALQLVERGQLSLDDAVTGIVPEFGELPVLDGFDGAKPRVREATTAATIRHLLTHTSGHGYWWANPELARYRDQGGMADILGGRREALNAPLVADPGSRWEYGISTDWLGLVVEAISGQDLATYLTEYVLEPLNMVASTFTPTSEQRAQLMAVHERTRDGGLKVSEFDWSDTPEFFAGGHGLYSTARDYGRFLRAMLRGGELDGSRVVSRETVGLAFSDQLGGLSLPEFVPTQAPWLMNDMVAPPFRQTWGFGFQLMCDDVPGVRRTGTGFWSGILNTYFWIDRRSGVAATVMTQLLPLFDATLLEAVAAFESAVYAGG